ncbi:MULTISPECIES: AAA family ATPase [unclassified Bradyrhizobium]|uniref:AAA family ATPase n=1 Tax=unclassified Bradyrhizobium TaxID=2631580 RepID=UPI001FF89C2B|nr:MULTISPECIES: AAA family ATPase [unclassified Bradyrhizobium]MCK1271086.1 AAA family ATPase [Bradyrhizobium sp. 84]MCK1375405.1 AAA family ATPase [Bradyrhizobium sp. 49]MCK1418457.1 AAA family ATPase [Bradyrhizobium sp. CW4]MCK1426761.1 AAA family ATPase [Bradyrhizobium sp. 87]
MSDNHISTVVEMSRPADDGYQKWAKEAGVPFAGGPIGFANLQLWGWQPVADREWAVFEHIPLGSTAGFYGEGGVGKSTAAMQLACACVTGENWFGLAVKKGPAFYLGSEDDEEELHRRLDAIATYTYLTIPSALARLGLHVASFAGRNMALARIDRDGDMIPTELYWRLYYQAAQVRPVVIVLDPLHDIYPGQESDRGRVSEFGGLLRQLAIASGAAVMVNAHPSQAGASSGSGTSGSTSWHGTFRARLFMRQDPDCPDGRIIEFKKNQYAKRGDSIRVRFDKGIFVRDEEFGDAADPAAAEQRAEQLFLDLLDRFEQGGRKVCDKVGTSYAPAKFADEPEAKAARLNKTALGAAMSRLFAARRIRVITEGPPSKQRSRIVRAS